ncbi:MAG: AAA family ATPase [Candidatus Thiodiazotropha sp. (ex Lucinoma borealis)]|nr:AAA family ATPase [Candidatus Thiodiazotropha sp. (ex Lucinoma borealis)]
MNAQEKEVQQNHLELGLQSQLRPIGLAEIEEIERRSYKIIDHLNSQFHYDKRNLYRCFTISKAAEMVGRTTAAIRDAENAGKLTEPAKNEKGRRLGYSLKDINQMREYFGSLPHRDSSVDECLVLAVQNFKGGCGKSTVTTHLAQYLALQGYRVCVLDCDPQASTTALFGINPDRDVEPDKTLFPFLAGEEQTLDYALRDTHWDQLKIVPSNLSLYETEYLLAGQAATSANGGQQFLRLRIAINTISDQFDIILIDPPPALGMISLSVLNAANALLVPVKPATVDFASTAHFFTMLIQTYEVFQQRGLPEPRFKFLKVLDNAMDDNKSAHVSITNMMERVYGNAMLSSVMKNSAEIDNAGARMQTVYELDKPTTSRETHNRCKVYLDAVNREVEILIRKTWQSHLDALRKQGLM